MVVGIGGTLGILAGLPPGYLGDGRFADCACSTRCSLPAILLGFVVIAALGLARIRSR